MRIYKLCYVLSAIAVMLGLLGVSPMAAAEQYKIDPAHSFIEFSIPHLGFSILKGRFNEVEGGFSYDPSKPDESRISVEVKTASIDSNHAERDKHLRGEDFLHVKKYPTASFKTTGFKESSKQATLTGDLTLHGVTRPITVSVEFVGAGNDPWGGYRRGYHGRTTITRSDFNLSYDLGPTAKDMDLFFFIEGIRQ